MDNLFYERFLKYRQIKDPCTKCKGVGKFFYPNTATYRENVAISGQGFTLAVCDLCWGSGCTYNTGEDLNKLHEEIKELKHEIEDMQFHEKSHKLNNGHFCPDWDYLFICDKCPEKEACLCSKS